MLRRPRVARLVWLALGGLLAAVTVMVAADWWIAVPKGKVAHYVGRRQCVRCHQKENQLWEGSDHDLAMARATPKTVLGNFDNEKFLHVMFKDLVRLTDHDVGILIDHVDASQWALALRDADAGVRQNVLANLAEGPAAELAAEMAQPGAVRPADVTRARNQIAQTIRRLHRAGEIRIEADGVSKLVVSTFFREGEKFFVTTDGPSGNMETFEIKYTFGVRPLQQYLIEFPGGRLQCLGIAWDTEQQQWYQLYCDERIPAGDELHWTRPSQNWNHMCAECHSTNLQKKYDVRRDAFDTSFSEIDVSCETCHGPGSLHVELADGSGLFWDRRVGYGLPPLKDEDSRVEIETCAPCHARRRVVYPNHRDGRPLPPGPRDGITGQKFFDYYVPELLDRHLYYPDGQILDEDYVYGSYIQSKMYHQGVRCTDCHDPHTARVKFTDADAPWDSPPKNRLCTDCHMGNHAAGKYDTPAHHHHPDASKPGTLCVDCHMPQTPYMVVDPRRDHSMRIPRPDLTIDLAVPNACNGCHHDRSKGETPEWAEAQLEKWYGKRTEPRHFAYAIAAGREGRPEGEKLLEAVTRRKDVSAMVRGSALVLLGNYPTLTARKTALRNFKDPDELVRHAAVRSLYPLFNASSSQLRQAVAFHLRSGRGGDPLRELPELDQCCDALLPMLRDPIRAVRTETAWVLSFVPQEAFAQQHRKAFHDALAEYMAGQKASEDRPESHMNMATVYINLGQLDPAEQAYLTAIRVNPQFLPARVSLATLYSRRGKRAGAERQLRAALQETQKQLAAARQQSRDPTDLQFFLAEVHYSMGLLLAEDEKQFPQAAEELAEAVRLAPNNPRMRYNYGLVLQYLDRGDEAEKQFQAAHKLDPAAFDYLNALVHLYVEQKRWARAIECAEQGVQRRPKDRQRQALLERVKQQSQQQKEPPRSLRQE